MTLQTTPRPGPTCPICGKPRVADWTPFCSKRCADVDLARWFGGDYAIAGEPAEPEDIAAAAPRPGRDEPGG